MFLTNPAQSQSNPALAWLVIALSLALSLPVLANTTKPDEQQPVEITANSLDANETKGVSVYLGQVVITQGSTVIKGEEVTLIHPNNQLEKAISVGKQATFKRYLPEEKKWIKGRANKITHYALERKIVFEGKAYIQQEGKNSIEGPYIAYDLVKKTLTAKSTPTESQRIKVIFTPAKTPEKAQEKAK